MTAKHAAAATRRVSTHLGALGLADVRNITSNSLPDGSVDTYVEMAAWQGDADRETLRQALTTLGPVASKPYGLSVNTWPMVEFRLPTDVVQMLADLGHLPGWPGQVRPGQVSAASDTFALDTAATRWYESSHAVKVGWTWISIGLARAADAAEILDFLITHVWDQSQVRTVTRATTAAVAALRAAGAAVDLDGWVKAPDADRWHHAVTVEI